MAALGGQQGEEVLSVLAADDFAAKTAAKEDWTYNEIRTRPAYTPADPTVREQFERERTQAEAEMQPLLDRMQAVEAGGEMVAL